jgi:hypothetical protein
LKFIILTGHQHHLFSLLLKEGLIPIPVSKFSDLPLIPTGDFCKITSDSGDAIHIERSAIGTGRSKTPACPVAEVTGGELR